MNILQLRKNISAIADPEGPKLTFWHDKLWTHFIMDKISADSAHDLGGKVLTFWALGTILEYLSPQREIPAIAEIIHLVGYHCNL